jgi:anti-sigma factor RsiW
VKFFKCSWVFVFLCTFLMFSICLPSTIVQAEPVANFKDIENHWAVRQISDWLNKDLVGGYTDGTFKPDNSITRAEFIALVNRAFGFTETVPVAFSDVRESDWYALEVAKASAIGYIAGYPDGSFKPNNSISRQETAAILAKILKPQATQNNLAKFTDNTNIPSWSRSSINAIVEQGYMGGYPDNSFGALNSITRAEAIAVLDRAVGALYNKAGVYDLAGATISTNVTISSTDVTLKNVVISGNLYLTEGIGDGHVTLDNVQVEGDTKVSGGGENSIIIINSSLGRVVIDTTGRQNVRLVARGTTTIGVVEAESGTKLEEENLTGNGFEEVIIAVPAGASVELIGDFDTVNIESPNANINVGQGTIQNITLAPATQGTVINLDAGATVNTFTAHSATQVTGTGTIQTANINANGVNMDIKPTTIAVAEGVVATVAGEIIKGDTPAAPNTEEQEQKPSPGPGNSKTSVDAVSITGEATVGQTLTATVTPSGATGDYQWQRADAESGEYVDIEGATYSTYTLTEADISHWVRVKVTGTGNYKDTVISNVIGFIIAQNAGVIAENFNTHVGDNYKGINVGFRLNELVPSQVDSIKVELLDGNDNVLATNTANEKLLKMDAVQHSTPFIITPGNYTEQYWDLGEHSLSLATKPVKAVITVEVAGGKTFTAENENLSEATAAYEGLFVPYSANVVGENFNTHAGTNYKGINVGFKLENLQLSQIKSMKVELYAGEQLVATNEALMNKMNELDDAAVQHSTPFIITPGGYEEKYWDLGAHGLSLETKPDTAVITIVDKGGRAYTTTLTSLSEATASYAFLFIAQNAGVIAENFNTHVGDNYKGINVGFRLNELVPSQVDSIKVELLDGNDNVLATNTANEKLLKMDAVQHSTPFIITPGNYTEQYWDLGEHSLSLATKPVKAVITVEVAGGKTFTAENENLSEATAAYEGLFVPYSANVVGENFNTHAGTNYKGINVGFKLENLQLSQIKSMKVELYAGEQLVATNEALMNKMNELDDAAVQHSTPFIITPGGYEEKYWDLGAHGLSLETKPDTAVITIVDKGGRAYTTTLTSLSEATASYAFLFIAQNAGVIAENFNTHVGDNYKGINVGFRLNELVPSQVDSIKVELLDGNDNVLATNTANEKLLKMDAVQHSTPFIITPGNYTEQYWDLGEHSLSLATKPVKAVITVEVAGGKTFTAENENLSEATAAYEGLFVPYSANVVGENFNTHAGTNYKGINVGFKLENLQLSQIKSMKVELYAGEQLVATNEALMNKMNELDDAAVQHSTPFIITPGGYEEKYWDLGAHGLSLETKPDTAVITIVDKGGRDYAAILTSFSEATASYESLFIAQDAGVIAENFNTHVGNNYKGINVGFGLNELVPSQVDSIKVELLDDNDEVLVTNTANDALLALDNTQHSTPFIINNNGYVEEYWNLGEHSLSLATKPVKAVITVEVAGGKTFTAENENLSEATAAYEALFVPYSATVNGENFNTHAGVDYKGINVGFKLENLQLSQIKSMKVELYAGEQLVATNEALMNKMEKLSDDAVQHSTPFIITPGDYNEEYWTLGNYVADPEVKPDKAVITIVDKGGRDYAAILTSFSEATASYESLFVAQDAGVIAENFNTHVGSDYKGLNVGFRLNELVPSQVDSIKVELVDGSNNVLATNTANEDLLAMDAVQHSTPFIINNNGYVEEYWNLGEHSLSLATKPVKAVITVEVAGGKTFTAENENLSEATAAYEALFVPYSATVNGENFNTHAGTDYKGLNVGFKLEELELSQIQSMTVELYAGEELLATNEALMEKMNELGDETVQHSTPFIITAGNYNEEYWDLGDYSPSEDIQPDKAVITIVDKGGLSYEATLTSLSEATASYASLFVAQDAGVIAENFNTHVGSDYKGLNVGFRLNELVPSQVDSIKVELVDGSNNVLATNTANEDLLAMDAVQHSTPFIVNNDGYEEEYWNLGEHSLSFEIEPAKAVITVVVNGYTYTAENANLSEATAAYEALFVPYSAEVVGENFNTHAGTDYKGLNVGFKLEELELSQIQSMTVELYAGEELLATNEALMEKMNELGDETVQHSTPFIITAGNYNEEYWDLGDYSPSEDIQPDKAVITIVDKGGLSYEATLTSLSEATASYASLFVAQDAGVIAENFNTHVGSDYKGLAVEKSPGIQKMKT